MPIFVTTITTVLRCRLRDYKTNGANVRMVVMVNLITENYFISSDLTCEYFIKQKSYTLNFHNISTPKSACSAVHI